MSNNKKISKWSPEWEKEIVELVGGEKKEQELKKGEVKPDGSLVTVDSEKIETNEFELLLGKIKRQKEIIKTKKVELGKKQGYAEEAKQILKEIKELDPKVKEWDKFASWFESAYTRFLEGGTNGYGTGNVGWKALLSTYLASKYKKVANTSPSETNNATATEDYGSNLYEFSTRTESWRITENEVVKLITRTVKALEDVEYSKFVTYTNAHAHPLSTNASEIDKSEYTASKLQGYLKDIQDRAKCLVDNKIKTDGHPDKGRPANGKRVEYSFGQDFTKFGTNTPQDSGNFTETELIGLFRLARACQDSGWTGHADFKAATANVEDDTLIVLPAKANPMTKSDFKNFTPEDLGIPVDSSGKSNFYATDYGSKVDNDEDEEQVEFDWDTQKELKIEQGIQGWTQLIHEIAHTDHNGFANRQKLISSFTNDPIRQLFTDIRSYVIKDNGLKTNKETTGGTDTPDYGCFGSGTDRWTYHDFPDHTIKEESRLNEYEAEKASLLESVKTGRESSTTAQKELDEAKKELVNKKKEVEEKITNRLKEFRKTLADNWKISPTQYKGFKKTATEDNRIELASMGQIELLLKQIRFLEHFDEEAPSSVSNEELARKELADLVNKIFVEYSKDNKIFLVRYLRQCEGNTEAEKIADFEKNYGSGKFISYTLQEVLTGFKELEELVKLSQHYLDLKKAVEDYLEKKPVSEKPADWQNDSALGIDFTDEIVGKWKATAKFKTIAEVKKLLQAVRETAKTDFKEDFLKWLKDKKIVEGNETSEKGIENWKALLKKGAKEVITAIEFYKYDKLDDNAKAEKKKQLVWTLEKKGEDGKYLEDADLTEEEIKTVLYEIAEGQTTLASEKKADEVDEDDNKNQDQPLDSWFRFGKGNYGKPLLFWGGCLLTIIGITAVVFWKQISEWWNGPTEPTEGTVGETSEKDEEE